MLTTMETWLRRSQRMVHKLALDPRIQSGARVAAWGGSGFFLSAASLSGGFQPLALGLATAVTGWRALVAAFGAAVGYRLFWGSDGLLGTVWVAAGCLLTLLLSELAHLSLSLAAGEEVLAESCAYTYIINLQSLLLQFLLIGQGQFLGQVPSGGITQKRRRIPQILLQSGAALLLPDQVVPEGL